MEHYRQHHPIHCLEQQENTEAPFIKAHAAKIALKKAADAQDGAAKAESKRIANEEKRGQNGRSLKGSWKTKRIKYKSDEARLVFEVLKLKHDNPDDADSIEKKYQEEEGVRALLRLKLLPFRRKNIYQKRGKLKVKNWNGEADCR